MLDCCKGLEASVQIANRKSKFSSQLCPIHTAHDSLGNVKAANDKETEVIDPKRCRCRQCSQELDENPTLNAKSHEFDHSTQTGTAPENLDGIA
jgi:hypothetical protein